MRPPMRRAGCVDVCLGVCPGGLRWPVPVLVVVMHGGIGFLAPILQACWIHRADIHVSFHSSMTATHRITAQYRAITTREGKGLRETGNIHGFDVGRPTSTPAARPCRSRSPAWSRQLSSQADACYTGRRYLRRWQNHQSSARSTMGRNLRGVTTGSFERTRRCPPMRCRWFLRALLSLVWPAPSGTDPTTSVTS